MQWPTRLGGYDVVRTLSAGGMGAVLLGEKRVNTPGAIEGSEFAKQVAIKVILPHLLSDENARGLFFDEARLAARLVHPNLVQTFDFGEEAGLFYLVMELVDGKSVLDLLRCAHAPLPPLLCARIVADAGRGLAWAHALADDDGRPLQVVHRDVSPDNLFLARFGAVKVLDFGVAKSRHRTSVSVVGTVRGKPPYMAPEQIHGDDVDARCDSWSLGVVLHELLSGEQLFKGQGMAVFEAVAQQLVPRLPETTAPSLQHVVDGLLERDRRRRLTTAVAVERLDLFLLENGGGMTPGALRQQLDAAAPALFAAAGPVVDDEGRPAGVHTAPLRFNSASNSASNSGPRTTPLPELATTPVTMPRLLPDAPQASPVVSSSSSSKLPLAALVGLVAALVVGAFGWHIVHVTRSEVAGDAGGVVAAAPAFDVGVLNRPDVPVADTGTGPAADVAAGVNVAPTGTPVAAVVPVVRSGRARAEPRGQRSRPQQRESAGLYVPDRNPYVDVVVDGVRVGVSPLGTAKNPFAVAAGAHTVELVEPASGKVVLRKRLTLRADEVAGIR